MDYIIQVLDAWGADVALPVVAINYKPASVEVRAANGPLLFGCSPQGTVIPNYMPPHWRAITKAKLIIGSLPSTFRHALECRFVYRIDHLELALLIESSPSAIKQWYHRSIKSFRNQWYSGLYSGVTIN